MLVDNGVACVSICILKKHLCVCVCVCIYIYIYMCGCV